MQKVLFEYQDELGSRSIVVPNYLPLASEDANFPFFTFQVNQIIFTLKFETFIPFGFINQMICFYGDFPNRKRFWRDRVLFTFNRKLILIQLDFDNLEINCLADLKMSEEETSYLFYSLMCLYWDVNPLSFEDISRHPEPPDTFENGELEYKWEMRDRIYNTPACHPQDLFLSVDNIRFVKYTVLCNQIVTTSTINSYECVSHVLLKETAKEIAVSVFQPFTANKLIRMKKVFISYSHEDIGFRKDAQKFLVNLEREKLVEVWQDGLLNPGDVWDEKITKNLSEADVIIMLLSQSFINSTYVHEVEMKVALGKASTKSAKIIPFLLKSCDWNNWKVLPNDVRESDGNGLNLGAYQLMPKTDNLALLPLVKWENQEDAWMQLLQTVRRFL